VLVTAGVVLHQIAGNQDGVTNGKMPRRVRQGSLERFIRIDPAQGRGGVTEQMWIRELDDSYRTHSFGLYKHGGSEPVMYVTPRFMAL
jgi:hypothetical protein